MVNFQYCRIFLHKDNLFDRKSNYKSNETVLSDYFSIEIEK